MQHKCRTETEIVEKQPGEAGECYPSYVNSPMNEKMNKDQELYIDIIKLINSFENCLCCALCIAIAKYKQFGTEITSDLLISLIDLVSVQSVEQ